MSAEIRVDRITSRSGINTFSFTETGISYGYNVGFGTTSPRANVDVEGNLIVTGGNAGIGTSVSTSRLNVIGDVRVSGVVTATSFSGDGTNLTGVSGFATALSSTQSSPLSKIFKTPEILDIGAGTSIKVDSDATSGNIAFMREGILHVSVGATFTVGSGTTFIINVLGVF